MKATGSSEGDITWMNLKYKISKHLILEKKWEADFLNFCTESKNLSSSQHKEDSCQVAKQILDCFWENERQAKKLKEKQISIGII